MKLLQLILVMLLGASLWLAYEFWPGHVIYENGKSQAEVMGGAELHLTLGGKDVAWPANDLFLGLAGVFAALMVATAVTHRRRMAAKGK